MSDSKATVSVLDLMSLQEGVKGLDPVEEGHKLDAEIAEFMAAHRPTQEHFAKRITI